MNSLIDKTVNVQSVLNLLTNSKHDWQSITITTPVKSGGCFATIVTAGSSGDTEMLFFSDEWPTILIEELVGLFLNESALLKGTNVSD